MAEAKILFKYTSRSRKDNFFRGLSSITENLHDKINYHILASFDISDFSMNNTEVIERLNTYDNLTYFFGKDGTKVQCINHDIDKFPDDWDILINFSDDQVIHSPNFDRIIREAFKHYFPDGDGVLHFPDTKTGPALITMSIMGRKYFERFGFIYHPDYISLHCDNEFGDTAKILGKYQYVDVSIYKHLHPMWKLAPMDAQYKHTESFYKQDGITYKKRKARNFDLIKYDWYVPIRKVKLSILICSLWERVVFLGKLIETFEKQLGKRISVDQEQFDGYEIVRFNYDHIEIVCCIDNRKLSIGQKRNILLEIANGEYEAQMDDDDLPTNNYIEDIMEGVDKGVDCCSLKGIITTNDADPSYFEHSLRYDKYETIENANFERGNVKYLRFPNHISCIKTEIARKFKFPEKNFSEDTDWALMVHKSRLLKTEHYISKPIYLYKYNNKK